MNIPTQYWARHMTKLKSTLVHQFPPQLPSSNGHIMKSLIPYKSVLSNISQMLITFFIIYQEARLGYLSNIALNSFIHKIFNQHAVKNFSSSSSIKFFFFFSISLFLHSCRCFAFEDNPAASLTANPIAPQSRCPPYLAFADKR